MKSIQAPGNWPVQTTSSKLSPSTRKSCLFLGFLESLPSVSESVKTTETIESLSQQDLLCKNLESYAEKQRGKSEMSMLDQIAAEAAALAEMQTQVEDVPTVVDSKHGGRDHNNGGSHREEIGGCDVCRWRPSRIPKSSR